MFNKLFTDSIANTPASHPYVRSKDQVLSYAEVNTGVRKLGTFFNQRGLAEGDYALLCISNDNQLAVIYLACLCSGLAAIICDPATPSLNNLLARTKPKLAFIDREKLADRDVEGGLMVIPVDPPRRRTRGVFKKILGRSGAAGKADATAYPGLLDAIAPLEGPFSDREPADHSPGTFYFRHKL